MAAEARNHCYDSNDDDDDIKLFNSGEEFFQDDENEDWSLEFENEDLKEDTKQFKFDQTKDTSTEKETKSDGIIQRMALNDGKAGMQGLDKEKINKIIHEASKGSKFYENEKRKEERVQDRVREMKRDLDKFTEADKQKAIIESDKMLRELDNEFDFMRTIVHVDMDAFYAAVEMRDDPKLKNVPMAVGGNDMLSTSNYLARKFGVRAAMPGFIAKKLCPNLVIVSSHFDKYRAVSTDIRAIFKDYDPNFSPMSLDEAYLDLTEYLISKSDESTQIEDGRCYAEIVVEEIRNRIYEKTQLTASAGIAPNLMLSKICSDFNKPNGQYYLQPNKETVLKFIQNLQIRKVFGIGRVTEQMLQALGVTHVKDLLVQKDVLYLLFSSTTFAYFMRVSQGMSGNRIIHDDRKSMSVERTFNNQQNKEELLKICNSLCQELANDLKKESLHIRNITLKYKLSSFVTKTRSKSIPYFICKADELFRFSKEILLHEINEFCKEGKKFELRLMGVRGSQFYDKTQSSSFRQNVVEDFFTSKNSVNSPEKQGDDAGPSTKADTELVPCPVCGIQQSNTNLDVLNAHIDACLTKQTIKEIVKEQDLIETKSQKSTSPARKTNMTGKRKSNEQLKKKESKKTKKTLHSFWNK